MRKIALSLFLGIVFFVVSCDKPANGQEIAPSNRYSFQVIDTEGGISTYVFDGKTGDVFVRTSDGKWWNISGIKTAEKSK